MPPYLVSVQAWTPARQASTQAWANSPAHQLPLLDSALLSTYYARPVRTPALSCGESVCPLLPPPTPFQLSYLPPPPSCCRRPARQHAVRNCLKVDQPTHRLPLKQRPIRMSHAFLMLLYLVYFIPGLLDSTRSHLIYWTLLDPAKSHLRANAQSDRSVRAAP